jgi:hypothetical protein
MNLSRLKSHLVVVLLAFIGAFGTSCIIHTPGHGRSKAAIKPAKDCPPSHYWDGEKCRHKGKGDGARKHDR